jgi:hypothetical protein
MWEGESVQSLFMKGELNSLPEGYYRALYTGKNLGVPVFMLCYSNPPIWTYKQALSNALLFGALPKPVDTGAPLEETSLIWKALDDFKVKKSVFKPYFKNDITCSIDNVKTSYYDSKKSMLLFVANTINSPSGKAKVKLPTTAKVIIDALTGDVLSQNSNEIDVEFDKFDYKVIKVIK